MSNLTQTQDGVEKPPRENTLPTKEQEVTQPLRPQGERRRRSGDRRRRSPLLAFLFGGVGAALGLSVVILIASAVIALRSGSALFQLARASFGLGASSVSMSEPVVVHRVQQMQRLETVMYTVENVVEGNRDPGLLPKFLTGDRLLMIGYGRVVAGVDFSKVAPKDVSVRGHAVHVAIPAAEVFSATLDNQKTKVYIRDTGLLVPADPQLESDVRREAERQLRQAALKDGILEAASHNARYTLTSFLNGLGFEHVEIR